MDEIPEPFIWDPLITSVITSVGFAPKKSPGHYYSTMQPTTILDPFTALSKYLKENIDKPAIDDIIFKLHYRATVVILMVGTILVTQRQYIGEHIKCINEKGVPENVINTFCFFSSTFTVIKHFNESAVYHEYLPHPGVGPHVSEEDEVEHHYYYQWVPFVLFLQGISFYIPHYIWRSAEGGRLKTLVSGLKFVYVPLKEDIKEAKLCVISEINVKQKIDILKQEFITKLHKSHNWSKMLVFCEFLNLVNLMIQVYLTDLFLGKGDFITLGHKVWTNPSWDSYLDPLDIMFPKVTKCTFYKYGPSGTIQTHDAMCVMALNVIHEKIYTVLWFWYLILFIFTLLGLLFRLIIIIMHSRSTSFNEFMFQYACPGKLDIRNITTVTKKCYFGDWLFLYFLAKNMNHFTFKELFTGLAEKLNINENPDDEDSIKRKFSYVDELSNDDEILPMKS